MSRTMRNTPHWVSKTQPLNWWWRGTRQNIRIVKGADGALRFPICASANKGVLNNWDDIYARGGQRHEVKARTHRQLRRHLGRDLARRRGELDE